MDHEDCTRTGTLRNWASDALCIALGHGSAFANWPSDVGIPLDIAAQVRGSVWLSQRALLQFLNFDIRPMLNSYLCFSACTCLGLFNMNMND
jgi:hypothetical protein